VVKISIYSVGKIKQSYFKEAINDYIKRLSSSYKIEHVVINPANYPDKISDKQIEQCKEAEGVSILKRLAPTDFVIALNLNRTSLDSVEFSKYLNSLTDKGVNSIVFLIGGSYGLGTCVLNRSNYQLTLSKMTLIHEMTIVFLLEQIYRSVNIQNNTPYHK
jgi:Uncharacterized conserved protein